MKKILLLTAPCPDPDNTPLHLGDARPPMGLGYIAAYLEVNGHKTQIIDLYQFDRKSLTKNVKVIQESKAINLNINIDEEIENFKPDFIGIYIHTISFYTACELGKQIKNKYPNIVLMCGGPHPTLLPETIPDSFDYVVVGEGEYAALRIVEGKENSRIIIGDKADDLDKLPFPNYDWFQSKPYNWNLEVFGVKV